MVNDGSEIQAKLGISRIQALYGAEFRLKMYKLLPADSLV